MASSSYLKNVKKSKESELKSYQTRKKQLEQILSNYDRDFDSFIDDINSNCTKINNAMERGLNGQARSDIILYYESSYDSYMRESRAHVFSEITLVSNKIRDLDGAISSLKTDISIAENEEREAKKSNVTVIV